MDLNTIKAVLDKTFEGIEVTPEQKNTLIGIYTIKFYRAIVDTLVFVKADDVEFFNKLNKTLLDLVNSLDQAKKQDFNTIIEKEKTRILAEVVNEIEEKLDPDMQKTVETNTENMAKKENPQQHPLT